MTNSSRKSAISKAEGSKNWFESRAMTVAMFVGCLTMAGLIFWQEGFSGLGDSLIYLILLACPLMHFFMHRGHGGHQGHKAHMRSSEESES